MSCHNIKKKSINKFENLNMNMENTLTNANHLTKKRQMRGSEKTKTELSKRARSNGNQGRVFEGDTW